MDIENLLDIPEGWSVVPLSSLVDPKRGISYGVVQPGQDVTDGVPIVRVGDLRQGRVDSAAPMRVAPEIVERYRRTRLTGGEVLLSLVGTVGAVAIAPPELAGWNTARAVAVIPPRADVDARWLAFCLRSPALQMLMESWCTTTVQSTLNLKEVAQLPIPLPPRTVQDGIVQVLSALEEKLEGNRLTNMTLQQLASTLFRSWFVDFDQVAAKRDGKTPVGGPAVAIDLFPSHFEESEVGSIPQGWRPSTIGAEVTVVGGSTPSTSEPRFWNGDVCWVTPRDLSRLEDPVVLDTERHITREGLAQISSGLLPVGTVLLSSRAPIGYIAVAEVPVAINQGFIAMKCDKQLSSHFAVNWVRENLDEVLSRAGGTTFAEISKAAFRPIPLVVPPSELLEAFDAIVGPLHAMRVANVRESRTLAELRDTLLGPVLSGELTIKSAANAVSAAL